MSLPPSLPSAAPTVLRTAQDSRTLSILFYVGGGLNFLALCFVALVAVAGVAAESQAVTPDPNALPAFVLLGVIGSVLLLLIALNFMAGYSASRTRRHGLCVAAAVVTSLNMPIGTVLGIYALVLLHRGDIEAAFKAPDTTGAQ